MIETEKIFFLTPVEYAILLAGKGVKQHYTLQADTEQAGEEEICLAMAHLYQTGLIDSDSEKFFIQEELDRLLTVIKEAEEIFLVRFGRHEKRDFCCFVHGEEMTSLRLSRMDENSYEIFGMKKGEFVAILKKSLETTKVYEPVLEEEECYKEIRNSRESITKEMIRKYYNLLLSVEQIEPDRGSVKDRTLVCFTEKGFCCGESYDMEEIKKVLEKIVEKGGN